MKIGVLAPSRSVEPQTQIRVEEIRRRNFPKIALNWHTQCFTKDGHFAGTDSARAAAILEFAMNPEIDAIWFARGGYGAMRLSNAMFKILAASVTARQKIWMGYSDTGAILARLYRLGFTRCYHGPMANDIQRDGGEMAIKRVFAFFNNPQRPPDETPHLPMNLSVLVALCCTDWMPPLKDHILVLEDIDEHLYAIDRMMFTLANQPDFSTLKGVKSGRFLDIPHNDIAFGRNAEEIIQSWCQRKNVPYLGKANIAHNVDNAIMPFGGN